MVTDKGVRERARTEVISSSAAANKQVRRFSVLQKMEFNFTSWAKNLPQPVVEVLEKEEFTTLSAGNLYNFAVFYTQDCLEYDQYGQWKKKKRREKFLDYLFTEAHPKADPVFLHMIPDSKH
ncbi:hypothetical protein V1264_022398 [Littorina saxatilis]|uniref:Uncharacterized protein n=1 Tax=Littorina saxatilis TaxID=31220 RepID=A0AAN9AKG8_9CAEN